jgi:serine/threonine protein kinase
MANEEIPFHYVPPVDPNIGRRVDRYFILRKLLGRGGMGAAYLAEHEARAHVKCVVKIVLAEIAQHPMAISRYNTEIHAVSLFSHDNIVRLQNFGVLDDGQLFSRFEYIAGTSLDRYVAAHGGRLDLRKAAYLIFQLCDALQYAHEQNVVHRDLKPDNLMIEVKPPGSHLSERVKLLDFGIAKVAGAAERTGSGISMGTPRYMAPEQATNAARATGRADVFSLGVIFYQIVTGDLPWGTPESDVAIYHKQQTEAPRWPPEDLMPAEVAAVVMRALSLKPEDRPSMHEFAIELASAIPAEGGKPSGTKILEEVKRDWVVSSPPHIPTLPRPVAADPTVPSPPPLASRAAPEASAPSRSVAASSAPNEVPASVSSESDLVVTANVRPGGRAAAVAATHGAEASSYTATEASAAVFPESPLASTADPRGAWRRPPVPVLAALPTGLVSQNYAAQPSIEPRAPSSVVASEIDLAVGTPGPQPFAHAELPAVMISRTQLSELTPQADAPAAEMVSQPSHREPLPLVVLPHAARRGRRIAAVFGILALSLMAAVGFALTRRGTHAPADEPTSGSVLPSAPTAANAEATEPVQAALGAASHVEGSGASVVDGEIRAVPTRASVVPAQGTPSPVVESAETSAGKTPNGTTKMVSGESSRRVVSPPSPNRKPLRVRQAAARASGEKTGNLHLLATPWALCWVDGEALDQTPCLFDGVPAGRYRVRLKNPDAGKDETMTVMVNPGETTTIEKEW